jgi:hypothetical protein
MFKIRFGFFCESKGRRLTNDKPVFDTFHTDISLTVDKLSEYLSGLAIKEPFMEALIEKGVNNKFLKITNPYPRKRAKFVLEATLKTENLDKFTFEVGSKTGIIIACELKFRHSKRFRVVADGLSLSITIERVPHNYTLPIPGEKLEKRENNDYYQPCVSSDSEVDLENPELMNSRYYNHNSVLVCQSCMLKR